MYRPFLPVDLAELSGAGQHQSWQIEATNLCFMHANAISELVEIGKSTGVRILHESTSLLRVIHPFFMLKWASYTAHEYETSSGLMLIL